MYEPSNAKGWRKKKRSLGIEEKGKERGVGREAEKTEEWSVLMSRFQGGDNR